MDELFVAWGNTGWILAFGAVVGCVVGMLVVRRRRATYGAIGQTLGYEERLQAMRSSLAGVSAAVEALTSSDEGGTPPSVGQSGLDRASVRPRIEAMLRQEVGRLQRLVDPGSADAEPEDISELRLDDLVETVVLARSLTGHQVTWHRTGLRVMGRRGEVLEVLTTLLAEADSSTSGAPAGVRVASHAGLVRVTVTAEGRPLRQRLFDRGGQGDREGSRGLGLRLASGLVRGMGGTLALEQLPNGVAASTVSLPAGRAVQETVAR